jgi:hypothetical protein
LELQAAKEELKELELWRKKGPIGKLHNILTFIRHSDQRNQLFRGSVISLLKIVLATSKLLI